MIGTVDRTPSAEDASDTPTADEAPQARRGFRPTGMLAALRNLGRLRGALVALLGIGLAAAVPLGLAARADVLDDARDAAVLAAAARTVSDLVTVDITTVQQSYDRLRAGATGAWADQLNAQSDTFVRAVQQSQVTSRGDITAAAIQRADDGSATVLVSASATVRNAQSPTAEPRQYRVAVDVVRQGEAWLVSKLDFVP